MPPHLSGHTILSLCRLNVIAPGESAFRGAIPVAPLVLSPVGRLAHALEGRERPRVKGLVEARLTIKRPGVDAGSLGAIEIIICQVTVGSIPDVVLQSSMAQGGRGPSSLHPR